MALSTFNNLMDRRNPRKSKAMIVVDESVLAKSAAWAWYEHGSGSDRRSIREVDVWRSKMEPAPSRYKLEALRDAQRRDDYDQDRTNISSGKSLLDSYEIERISKQLSHYIEASHAKYHGGDTAAELSNRVFLKRKTTPKGFWLRHVPVCGSSRSDVVEIRGFECRQKLPEKGGVAVVGGVGCRPRPSVANY